LTSETSSWVVLRRSQGCQRARASPFLYPSLPPSLPPFLPPYLIEEATIRF
jgi:hypothetical protein